MMRKFVLVILLATISTGVMALGLGNIELNSGLNQPFDARIELLSPTASELDNLTITLADTEAFERAGIERLFVLSSLRFAVQISESGKDYIHITTQDVMREPFLNFLIDASWSNGRLFREYTVLLDPPLYDPNAHRSAQVQTTSPAAASSSVEPLGSGTQPTTAGEQTVSNFSGNEVGPTAASDTLWSLANRVKPDSTISVNQMMVALLRANPEAFIGNNINGLKQGQILRVPAIEDITSTSFAAAIEEVRSQNAMWEEVRGTLATDTAARPVSTSVETAQGSSETQSSQTGSELRLLAASNESANTSGSSTGAATGNNSEANSGLMSEQLESVTSENADLRDRLNESDTIIQDLKRLIQLKDDELATLQKQMGGTGVAPTTGEPAAEPTTPPAEVAVEPAPVEVSTQTTTTEETAAPAEAAPATVTEQPVIEEAPKQAEVATAPEPVAAPAEAVKVSTDESLLDQILSFIFVNIIVVGGGLGGVILLAVVASFIRKRKAAAANDPEVSALTEFPDFETPADASGNDGPQIEAYKEAPAAADKLEATIDVPIVSSAPAQQDVAEEDPLAEVNVFLAYEHFDSAEEFVREAITRQPKNLDFHSKLLEVFYSAGDKVKYEAEAKVLYDLGGTGPHWDMATIMWQEMSPSRQLFEQGGEGEEDAKADITSGRGIVDLTADENSSSDEAGLDFDLGMAMEDSAPASGSAGSSDLLDITAGSGDVLDVTGAGADQHDTDSLLDVTAAVGLSSPEEEYSLDLPSEAEEDILDISASGSDDPLDVTAHSDIDSNEGENLLDISASSSANEEPLEFNSDISSADDNALDFDIGGLSAETPAEEEGSLELGSSDENLIDFDDQSVSSDTDGGIELDLGTGDSAEEGSLELSMDTDSKDGDSGLELDFGLLDSDTKDNDGGLELDFDSVEEVSSTNVIDLESTVKVPKGGALSLDSDDDDDDDDHTVFVPRTNDAGEQSAEDENATKLDLAKAYVELGDESNAKSILEEVIAEGSPAQRRQAQELMSQIS